VLPDTIPLEPIHFENNTLLDNNLHMVLLNAHNSEVVNNQFEGTGPSERMAGLWFSGENVLVQGNQFWEMEAGIRAAGTDPVDIGFAENASLIDNRFCEVGVPIELQEGSTVSETGTLSCPFPEPELGIVKSVRLSWPGYYDEDFVLEGAPSAEGPWNPLGAEISIENGSHTTYVPAEVSNQFFRLTAPQQ
jgi:hypothetical protein